MARLKNALRGHFIAGVSKENPDKEPTEWLELAKYISNVETEDEEESDSEGFYDGDGTPEEFVKTFAAGYTFEGYRDHEDPAQNLICGMKFKTGEGRRVWHKVVSSNGKKEWVGRANVSGINDGSGEATEDESFGCTIKYVETPKESAATAVVPGT